MVVQNVFYAGLNKDKSLVFAAMCSPIRLFLLYSANRFITGFTADFITVFFKFKDQAVIQLVSNQWRRFFGRLRVNIEYLQPGSQLSQTVTFLGIRKIASRKFVVCTV